MNDSKTKYHAGDKSSKGNPHHSNHKKNGPKNHKKHDKPALSNSQVELLQEIVQQNHTMIGLLRGIKFALSETVPPVKKTVIVTPKNSVKPVVANAAIDSVNEVDGCVSEEKPKKKRQFVMRFDDKEPLNKDLDDTLSVVSSTLENSLKIQTEFASASDENSVGEVNPFEFFSNSNEE